MTEMFEALRTMQDRLASLPPRPWCFMASHSVPYGRVYRQWDTRGRLLVWVNRGEVADMPLHRAADPNRALAPSFYDSAILTGIPVVTVAAGPVGPDAPKGETP